MIKEVLSRVELEEGQAFRDVCYEWEEEIAKYFNVPVRQVFQATIRRKKTPIDSIKKLIKTLFPFTVEIKRAAVDSVTIQALTQDINLPLSVCFVMLPGEISAYLENDNNLVPIFLDCWDDYDFEYVIRRTKNFKIFYVTSRDVYNRVKSKSPSSNVYYMPQSISDKYHSENFAKYRNKKIDVLHSSRINPVLHEYMLEYLKTHNNIEYVYKEKGEKGEYISTKRGCLGFIPDRESYMKLIASSKISLVGCSGIDNARENTNGIQFVTPRFYESAILGCALIGRYPDNQEFRELNMSKYCPNITSYEQFCKSLELALNITPEELYSQNHDFIINSLTSQRAKQIERDLREIIYHD